MSYISNTYNNVTRMTGLSGLDVEGLVSQLMQLEKTKVSSVSQSRQTLLWKQEQYREITSALQSLNTEFFNSLKPASDMRNSSIYNAFALKYDGLDTNPYFTASAGSGAKAGSYTISNIVTAATAKINGSAAAGSLLGSALTTEGISAISSAKGNNVISVEFNGTIKEITLSDGLTNISQLASDLQGKLNAAFGSGKITVGTETNSLTFATSNTNTLKFSSVMNKGSSAIFGSDLSAGFTATGQNNKFKMTLGNETKEFTLQAGTTYANADAVASAIQSMVDDSENGFGPGKVKVRVENNRIVMESVDTATKVSVSAIENGGLAAIGMYDVNRSNKINLDAKLYDIRNSFTVPLAVNGSENDISFTINDKTFSFSSRTTSMSQIMAAVNADTDAGVRMSYDTLNNKFIVESRKMGVTATISSSDSAGGLLGSLSLAASNVTGRDASITYNDGVNGDQTIVRSSNSFSVNGITFNLKKDNAGSVELSASSDPTKAVELIKSFVNKYNEVLDKINSKLTEKREYSYSPLTDDQKDAMTEDEVKKWEEKAKAGLLGNDNLLRSIATGLRNSVMESVTGTGLTLASIGIKSNSWVDRGKLYIDEEKLKNALSENPDEVFSLFTKQSDVLYSTAAANASSRNERFQESGLIYRISDVIQDNIRTSTIDGRRGALLEKAGMTGDRSLYNNMLYDQISDYDDRIAKMNDELIMKENSYYYQFSQLETLINNMNTQSTWLSQQFAR